MTDSKILHLVVDNEKNGEAEKPIMSMGVSVQIKYVDEECVVVKSSISVNGHPETSTHVLIETPKD